MSSGRKKTNKCLEGKRELDHGKMCSFESQGSHGDTPCIRPPPPQPPTVVFPPPLPSPTTTLPPPRGSSRRRAAVRASCKRISAPLCSSDIIFPPRRLRPHEASSPVSRLLLFLLPSPLSPPPIPTSPNPRGTQPPASWCPLCGISTHPPQTREELAATARWKLSWMLRAYLQPYWLIGEGGGGTGGCKQTGSDYRSWCSPRTAMADN